MAIEKKIVINVDAVKAAGGIDKLTESLKETNKEVKETSKSTEAMSGTLDKATGGAVSKFNAFKGSLKGVIGGFKTLRGAIISTGIGALVIAVTSLIAAFKGSEEGQNKFAKLTTIIGAAVGNVVDLMADLGEGIISVFENPKQALINFKNLLVENITNRFKAILDTVGFLGSAIKNVFSGEFQAALDDAKKAGSSFVDSFTGVENSIDKATAATKRFIEEQKRELGQAAAVADMRAKADKIERKLIVDRSKLESEIANLRLKSRQEEEFSAAERKQALLDAQKLEEELLDKETQFLELRRDAQILENTFSRSNKENLTKEAEAIAAVNRQQAARANAARQVQREVNTISKQIEAENKRIANEQKAAKDKEIADEQARLDAIDKIKNDYIVKQENKDADTELKKINLEEERKIAELDRLDATEQQKQAIRDYYAGLRDDLNAQSSQNEIDWNEMTLDEKLKYAQQGFSKLANNLGKETAAGKAAAISSALISTYQSATDSYKSLSGIPVVGPALGFAAAGAATAAGLANVKAIASTKTPSGGGGGSSVPSGARPTQAQPPSFNVVGATETSQLAEAVGGQAQQPVQAYVVANDVTTAQSLENNIVEGATL